MARIVIEVSEREDQVVLDALHSWYVTTSRGAA